ncbi:Uncharacterised protein [Bordetella pertussis]|nr:Uncharacterised protein [Bordetella pertussis]
MSRRLSSPMTSSPICSLGTSRMPLASRVSSMRATALSTSSVLTGRLRKARDRLPRTLPASYSVRLPSRLTTDGMASSTRS